MAAAKPGASGVVGGVPVCMCLCALVLQRKRARGWARWRAHVWGDEGSNPATHLWATDPATRDHPHHGEENHTSLGGLWHQTNLHQTVTHGSARGADKGGMIHQHGRERAIFDVARPPTPRPTPLSGGGPFGTWACWSTLPCEYALRNYFCRASTLFEITTIHL